MKPRDPIEVHAEYRDFGHALHIAVTIGDSIAMPLQFQPMEGWATPPLVDARHGKEFMQAMLDRAWSLGLRPAGFHDVPNTMAATNRHLEDMRTLVFRTLNMEKPDGR